MDGEVSLFIFHSSIFEIKYIKMQLNVSLRIELAGCMRSIVYA